MTCQNPEVSFSSQNETGTPRGDQEENIFPASEDKFVVGFEVYFQKISLLHISIAVVIITNNKIFG